MQENLSSKQSRTLLLLLSGNTIEQAAEHAGVNPATIHRWLKDETFVAVYRDASSRALEQAIVTIQAAAQEAARVLLETMQDAEAPASVRLRAAQLVLDACLKWREAELLQRVEQLEQDVTRMTDAQLEAIIHGNGRYR